MSAQADLTDMDQSWTDFLNDALDATQRTTVLKSVASDFDAAVARHAESAVFLETLGRVLSGRPLSEETWPSVERTLSLAYGPNAVRLMRWLVEEEDDIERRLDEVAPMLEVLSERLLRDVLARHARDLFRAYYSWNYSAHEWEHITTNVRQSANGQIYFISVTIEKVNGEQITFQSRANQLLLLGRAFLVALNDLPAAAFTSLSFAEAFTEQAQRLLDTLSASSTASNQQKE
jgi:hypothetical protein